MELKGMYDDSLDRANHPEGTWTTNTRNIVITKDKKSIKNEDGFIVYATNYNDDNEPIGHIALPNDRVVVFSINHSSEIGIIEKDGTYRTIVRDDAFAFDKNYYITGTYQFNAYGEIEIVFTDGNVSTKILNIDKLPFKLNVNKTLVDPADINNCLVFPDMILPEFWVDKVENVGGSIDAGVIYLTGQYEDSSGALTNTFPLSNPISIAPSDGSVNGTKGGYPGSKTSNIIKFTIESIDTRFKKIRLIVVRKSNGQTYSEAFNKLSISGDTMKVIYTGTETTENVSLSEVLVDRPSYNTATSVLADNDILYLSDVSSLPCPNIQKYVNNWNVKYISYDINMLNMNSNGSLKNGAEYFSNRPALHNEVYALYAVPVMLDGNYGNAFHIPGRVARPIQGITNPSNKLENELVSNLYTEAPYLTEDNAISSDVRYFHTRDTSSNDGTLGYWENQNEVYPNTEDWEAWDSNGFVKSLRGQKVRHHKTPTIDKHGYANVAGVAPCIGFQIENMWLPSDIASQIQAIEIFYAKRTGSNSTLAGRSLMVFAGSEWASTDVGYDGDIGSNAGNWEYQDVSGGARVPKKIRPDYIRMRAFDMLVNKTNILPNFIYNNKKLIKYTNIDSNVVTASTIVTTDFTLGDVQPVTEEYKVRGIQQQQYQPHNTIMGNGITNRFSEETFFARFKGDTRGRTSPNYMGLTMGVIKPDSDNNFPPLFETYITDLCIFKEDAYLGFNTQELATTGVRRKAQDLIGGSYVQTYTYDGYYGVQGDILTAETQNTEEDDAKNDGIRNKVKFYVETANPPELQYGDFYPAVNIEIVNQGTSLETEYPIYFNRDYTSINNLVPVSHYDFEVPIITRNKNRILRSQPARREERVSSWRIFLANNYFEGAKNRGRIVHLEAINNEILIQCEYGLFITRGNTQLNADISTIEIGDGDVFSREPKEIVDSKHGYIGCQSKLACGKFKGGYFTADESQGKIFIMDNSLNEVSNYGMYGWFKNNLPRTDDTNQYYNGLVSVYDEAYNRIIFTKKEYIIDNPELFRGDFVNTVAFKNSLVNGDIVFKDGRFQRFISPEIYENVNGTNNSFTTSFSLEINGWVCMHDYIPNMLLSTANKLMSFRHRGIYLHNVPNNKGKFYDGVISPSSIEPVFVNLITKLYHSINWKSQYRKDNVIDEKKTFTSIMLYNNKQCSGTLPITLKKTTRNAEGLWKFNEFRDLVKDSNTIFLDEKGNVITSNINTNKPFFKQARFFGDYLCVRLTFDNADSNAEIVLSEFSINDKVSYR